MATKDDTSLNWERHLQTEDNTLLNEDDIFEVMRALVPVAAKWRAIGEGLGIAGGTLDTVEAKHRGKPQDCMDHVVREWLRLNYKTGKFGEPTWRKLAEVVADPAGGRNSKQAEEIARDHLVATEDRAADINIQPSEDNKHKSFFSWRWVTVFITMSVVALALWFQGGALLTTVSFHPNLYHSPCLPYPPEVFVGRENEMRKVMQLVNFGNTKNRLVSIVGPPGFGKSTLAIHLGHEMVANGITVYYVDMGEVSSSQALAEKVLDCDPGIVSIKNVTVDRLYKWARGLSYQTLLILDNCDDMLHKKRESLQKTVKNLFAPKLKVLMTSRERMLLSEFKLTRYPLHELTLNASCELLQNVAEGLNSTLCHSIANLTGNVPLALKVVGALLTELDELPEVIISQLNQRLFSTFNRLPKLDEQVNASIGLSYQYLSQRFQKIGRYLANFPGSFDKDSAHNVLLMIAKKPPPERFKARMLQEFVQRSLLEYNRRTNRYQFHRLIREFFLDIQRSIGDSGQNETRRFTNSFVLHYTTVLDSLTSQFTTDHREALATLDIERHNIERLLKNVVTGEVFLCGTFATLKEALSTSFLYCRFTDGELIGPVQSAVNFLDKKWEYLIHDGTYNIFDLYVHLVVFLGEFEEQINGMSSAVEIFLKRKDIIESMGSYAGEDAEWVKLYTGFYTKLSHYQFALNKRDDFRESHEKILKKAKVLSDHDCSTCSDMAIGRSYQCMGKCEQSVYFLQQAILGELGIIEKAVVMIDLYKAYTHMQQYKEAQELLEDIFALVPSLLDVHASLLLKYYDHHGFVLQDLTKFFRDLGRYQDATALEKRQLEVIQEIGSRPLTVSTVKMVKKIVEDFIQIKDFTKAANLAQFAISHFNEGEMDEAEELKLELHLLAGKAKFWGGNYSEGMDHFVFVVDFIYEHNASANYTKQLKEACPYVFLRARIRCLANGVLKIVFAASVKVFQPFLEVQLNWDEVAPSDTMTKAGPIKLSRSTELSERYNEMAIYSAISSISKAIFLRLLSYITSTVTKVAIWIIQIKLVRAAINVLWIWMKLILIYYCLHQTPHIIITIRSDVPVQTLITRLYCYISACLCLCSCLMLTDGIQSVGLSLIRLDIIIHAITLSLYFLHTLFYAPWQLWVLFEQPVIIFNFLRLMYHVFMVAFLYNALYHV